MVRVLFAAISICRTLLAADTKPDLSGHWELNIAKSSFGNMPKPTRMTLDSEYKSGTLHATQTTYTQEGSSATEGTWYLDGKNHPLDLNGPGGGISMSKWDSSTLVSQRKSNDGQYQEDVRVTLSRDGKTATEKLHVKNPNGTNSSTLV